ncbi:MAG: hypothetical protein ACRD5G_03380, partial [Candidatus Acidiferrales bacterium]
MLYRRLGFLTFGLLAFAVTPSEARHLHFLPMQIRPYRRTTNDSLNFVAAGGWFAPPGTSTLLNGCRVASQRTT